MKWMFSPEIVCIFFNWFHFTRRISKWLVFGSICLPCLPRERPHWVPSLLVSDTVALSEEQTSDEWMNTPVRSALQKSSSHNSYPRIAPHNLQDRKVFQIVNDWNNWNFLIFPSTTKLITSSDLSICDYILAPVETWQLLRPLHLKRSLDFFWSKKVAMEDKQVQSLDSSKGAQASRSTSVEYTSPACEEDNSHFPNWNERLNPFNF